MFKGFIYLFLGDDWISKQQKISQIKKQAIGAGLPDFNIDTFYADEVSDDVLKNSLYTLAAVQTKRVLVIKNIEKPSPKNKKLILSFINKPNPNCILILDSQDTGFAKNSFLKEISKVAQVFNLKKTGRKENVFDLCRAIAQQDQALALRILSHLLSSGEKPLKILGGISWYWTNKDIPFKERRLRQNLDLLLQADTNIKTGKMNPNCALEFLVLRLAAIS